MLSPFSVFFPFSLAVRRVIVLHIAMATAVSAFVRVAWSKNRTAAETYPIEQRGCSIQNDFLSLKKYGCVSVNPIAEGTDANERGVPKNVSRRERFTVLFNVSTRYPGNEFNSLQQTAVAGDAHREKSACGFACATITIKNAADEMINMLVWQKNSIAKESDSRRKVTRAYRDGGAFLRIANRVFGTQSGSEALNVLGIDRSKSEHERMNCGMPVRVEKTEPIRFSFVVDQIEKMLINVVNPGSCHGDQ